MQYTPMLGRTTVECERSTDVSHTGRPTSGREGGASESWGGGRARNGSHGASHDDDDAPHTTSLVPASPHHSPLVPSSSQGCVVDVGTHVEPELVDVARAALEPVGTTLDDWLHDEPGALTVRSSSPYCVEVETGMVMTLVHPCMEPVHVHLLQLQRAIGHEAARLRALRRRAKQFQQDAYPVIGLDARTPCTDAIASAHPTRSHHRRGTTSPRRGSRSSSSSGRDERHVVGCASGAEQERLLRECLTSIYVGKPLPTLNGTKAPTCHARRESGTAPVREVPHDVDGDDNDDDAEDGAALQPLTPQELGELRQCSERLALLYQQRGVYLRRMDVLLRQHASCNERWESNEERTRCYRCHRAFSTLTRRHHCRRCGRLCCAECSCHFGKKQDTSCLPPGHAPDLCLDDADVANDTVGRYGGGYGPHNVVRTEYAVRLTATDTGEDPEQHYDRYTYPTHTSTPAPPPLPERTARSHAEEFGTEQTPARRTRTRGYHVTDLNDPATVHDEERCGAVSAQRAGTSGVAEAGAGTGGGRSHGWVRMCTTCYNHCLRARKTDILKRTKNANRCILDDGYYYFYVLTADELRCLGTLMDKPDSLRKQVELQSCALLERSADYIVGVPGYGTRMLTSAAQQTPQVLRTLGSMSLYAARRARKVASECVENYLVSRDPGTRVRQRSHDEDNAPVEVDDEDEPFLSRSEDDEVEEKESSSSTCSL